jgi:glycosyltransferase involved in cell wall biosynthesis
MNRLSRNFMPYLMNACDIYAAPSRLEGFGMPQVEAGACGKPVIGIKAMGMLDTLVHGETALLAEVAQEILLKETMVFNETGSKERERVVFPSPRTVDYRASVHDIANYLIDLMESPDLRRNLGEAARKRVVDQFDYKIVAKRFVEIISKRLGIS